MRNHACLEALPEFGDLVIIIVSGYSYGFQYIRFGYLLSRFFTG